MRQSGCAEAWLRGWPGTETGRPADALQVANVRHARLLCCTPREEHGVNRTEAPRSSTHRHGRCGSGEARFGFRRHAPSSLHCPTAATDSTPAPPPQPSRSLPGRSGSCQTPCTCGAWWGGYSIAAVSAAASGAAAHLEVGPAVVGGLRLSRREAQRPQERHRRGLEQAAPLGRRHGGATPRRAAAHDRRTARAAPRGDQAPVRAAPAGRLSGEGPHVLRM